MTGPPAGNGILELYTFAAFRNDVDWQAVVSAEHCAYLGRQCYKVRKSSPEITIGTCTVAHNVRTPKEVIICPARFMERNQIFTDCLHLLTRHEPGNELHCVPELEAILTHLESKIARASSNTLLSF